MTGTSRGGSGRRPRRGRGKGAGTPRLSLTSVPTGRAAYAETRVWLLAQHGPVCAYCERVVAERSITLDHVTPRRGQTAYDRRDNLVLACKPCNSAKMDKPILAFLLGSRKRVVALYKYGRHLSHQLVEMVDDLLPPDERPALPLPPHKRIARRRPSAREILGDLGDESPYHGGETEESPYLDHAAPHRKTHAARPAHAPASRGGRQTSAAKPRETAAGSAPARKRRRRGGRGRGSKS
ncbi:MAG: HNH endonuclease [Gemmatimonadetes bacterium]|nr:HNH endonuclease [Gemmatimonadota bacterium]MBI3567804.1 HNH endonuclease [Gemmatimonadota bacterium]